jgi:hypothetical protein
VQPATTTMDARGKLAAIERELGAEILEREEVVRSMVLALIAGEHVLLLGPPGTAKSRLARSLCERIAGASYFYVCLNRSSLPDEVFGPTKLSALREDRFERNTSGMLPEAQVAFIDEVFKCLAGGTLVTLPNGERRRIDSFSERELPVLDGFDGRRVLKATAVRIVRRPAEQVYKVTLASGKEVRATADHKFLARRPAQRVGGRWFDWSLSRWTELSLLQRGYYVATPAVLNVEGDSTMPGHEVALAGLLIADGGCTQPQIRYTKADPDLVAFAREQVASAGHELVPVGGGRDTYRCRSTNVRALVRHLGMDVLSTQKRVPDQILRLTNHQLALFVGVLWSGDGYVNPSRGDITYGTSSKGLALDLQHALLRFGVISDVTHFETTDGYTDARKTAYRLRVRRISAQRFIEAFGEHMVGGQPRTSESPKRR